MVILKYLRFNGIDMTLSKPPRLTWQAFLPKHWGAWLIIGFLYLLSLLPTKLSWPLGKMIGRLAQKILKSRCHIATRNLQICFPQASAEQIQTWVDETFERFGLALVDTATAWFWGEKRFYKHMYVEGGDYIEKLRTANPKGGILIISMHFYTLEWHARMYGAVDPGVGVYRPNRSPVYEHFQHRARIRTNHYLVDRHDVRGMLRALRQGEALWYAPDHDYGKKASVFVQLFNEPHAATVAGTATLARAKGVQPLVSYARRNMEDRSYTLVIKPFTHEGEFPTKDNHHDARAVNMQIEQAILDQLPEYMWIHRRFKSRPEGEAYPY